MSLADSVNVILGVLTVAAELLVVLFVVFVATGKPSALAGFLSGKGAALAFAAALIATLGSLTYSEILGYEPCKLCWLQRIFMYPQVLVLGFALWGRHKGSRSLLDLSVVLSSIGAVVSLYHYLMQLGIVPEGSCAAVGYSVSCAQRFVMQFGYITIPLMAFSAFLLILTTLLLKKKQDSIEVRPQV